MMIDPAQVFIDGLGGDVTPRTGHYRKTLREMEGMYQDAAAWAAATAETDSLTYEVKEYRQEGADLFFGTTTMYPGKVGDEYYMTRGHFHIRDDMGEVYYTQSGLGVLVLEDRAGETREVAMSAGSVAFIPPGWAHRSINTGTEPLVFVWVVNVAAGNDYAEILERGMRRLVVEENGVPVVRDNPSYR